MNNKQPIVDGYTVVAGKYEPDFSENIKYIETFTTLDEALKEYVKCYDYPFVRIELSISFSETLNPL